MFDEIAHPADYCFIDSLPQNRLSAFERLTITGGRELERAIGWVSKQLSTFPGLDRLGDIKFTKVEEAAKFYSEANWPHGPQGFFVPPNAIPAVAETVVHGLQDGEILDLQFQSAYQVQFSQFAAEFENYSENKTVHVRLWRHSKPASATIVAIHGWTMGDQRINSLAFVPGIFYRQGLDVALIELPYHGRRRPTGDDKNVSFFPSTNVSRTNEAMAQTVSDLRSLKMYLDERGSKAVGAIGMSLGGDAAALWSALDDLAFCIPIVPLVSMAELAWDLLSRHHDVAALNRDGITADLLRELYWLHSPLSHTAPRQRERLMIIAGIGDQIVPPRQPKLLWDHWKRPALSWLGGGHIAQFKRAKAMEEIMGFLRRLGYIA